MALKDTFYKAPPVNLTELPERINGVILHTNKKGFGFIQSPLIPFERIYFYWTALNQENQKKFLDIKTNDKVEFTPKKYDKGWRAIKITIL
jgi:cold shock CspA family protein